MKAPQTNTLEQRITFPLEGLMALDLEDVSRTVVGECIDDITELGDNMADCLH